MPLSPHSRRQLDPVYLHALEGAALRVLSVKRLEDLKEARDRLHQGPENRSRPPGRRAPWETLMAAVYAAPEGPPLIDLPAQHAPLLTQLRTGCEQRQHSTHTKTTVTLSACL